MRKRKLIKILLSLSILALLNSCSDDSESSVSSRDSDAGERDSVVVHDSVNVKDSVRIIDSVVVHDSVRIIDSVEVRDSVRIKDSVIVKDSVKVRDSVRIVDSLHIIDSVNVKDSIEITDSIQIIDSVVVRDSVVIRDLNDVLGKCAKDNAGKIMPYMIDDGVRYFDCDANAALWRGASKLEVNNYYIGQSDIADFEPLDSVINSLAEGERIVVVVRHAERNSDSASSQPLNANGFQQSLDLGKKLNSSLSYHFGASGSIRTQQTCNNIAKGLGLDGADTLADTLSHMGDSWYVKDDDAYTKAKNDHNGSWYVLSRWAYKGDYSEPFYEFKPRCSEWIDSVAIPFAERTGTDVSFIATHDLLIMPLVVYVSDGNVDLRYYRDSSKRWLNYLAGFAIVLKPDGSRVFHAVKGLELGWMTP
jgi:broad specificity phosphatase PhoE